MNLNVKRKNLFLLDDISPYKNFINARKTLKTIYKKEQANKVQKKTIMSYRSNYNNINNINKINLKYETQKIQNIKPYSQKLLNEQQFIITRLLKEHKTKKDNFSYYNTNSLLKTLDRLNYNRYNNNKINMFTKYSHKNIFKTLPLENIKQGYKSVRKQKINYENFNLPIIKYILRKKTKIKNIL